MAVTLGNALLLAGSILAAVCALFWPNIEQAYVAYNTPRGSNTQGAKGKCPLGYEGPLPSNHPPIPGSLKGSTSGAAGSTQQYVTYANAVIWTADVEAPWAVNMTVNLATGDIVAMGYDTTTSSSSSTMKSSSGGASTRGQVIDMQGAFLMPGFVDPHVHLIPGGLFLKTVNLRGLQGGRQQLADRLAAAAAAAAAAGDGSSGGSNGGRKAWLIGVGWSESDWGGELPDKTWIDEVCGGRPAFLSRMDSHMALVNTAALEAAGLMKPPAAAATAADGGGDSDGGDSGSGSNAAAVAAADAAGLIDRDPHTGLPTGLLRESAMYLVECLIPTPSLEDRAAALQDAGRYLLSHGVTSVGDMGWGLFGSGSITWEDLEEVYDTAAAARGAAAAAAGGEGMPVRVSAYVPLRTWKRLATRIAAKGTSHPHSSRLTWGGVKEFADGSLGSNTALMWDPYLDTAPAPTAAAAGGGSDSSSSSRCDASEGQCSDIDSSSSSSSGRSSGTRIIPTDELLQLVKGAATAGLQVAVHAIGDRAVDEVTQVYEQVLSSSSSSSRVQHRIEHVQHISSPQAAAKMAALSLSGVPNPQHLLTDRPMLVPKLGFERSGPGRAFAYKTLADAGVRLGFGSDWPVVEVDPWTSVFAAVYRKDPPTGISAGDVESDADVGKSERVWESEEERLSLSDVLLGHTLHAARVARLDHWVGKLAPGFKADFVVLSQSPFELVDRNSNSMGAESDGQVSSSSSSGGAAVQQQKQGLSGGLPVVQQTFMDGVCVFSCEAQVAQA